GSSVRNRGSCHAPLRTIGPCACSRPATWWSNRCWPVSADEHRRVPRLDGDAAVRAIRAAGGPPLTIRAPMPGGEVGAFLVERDDGTEWVLTVEPPLLPGAGGTPFEDALELMELARDWGVPVPRYETVIPLPDGRLAVLQERAPGVPVTETT